MRFLCLSQAALLISLTLIAGLMPTTHASTNTARHATRYGVVAARDQVAATGLEQGVKIARDDGQLQSGSVLQKVLRKKADAAFPRSEPGQKERDELNVRHDTSPQEVQGSPTPLARDLATTPATRSPGPNTFYGIHGLAYLQVRSGICDCCSYNSQSTCCGDAPGCSCGGC
ncbi:hypothetical protein BDZ90DRAFT_281627 [Jaminaea rosea]|uniref:Uncharacterized protein n=1 Tax=Jaminaea rosea TaxID=1569628 RepID=A0A316UNC7_9BASI|nr:hypothetical protein BDZ90DRAFT_281627 [Jaminaea rosea]PWN25423.1 hypothetical protein BDZ90DRAFT_281627 [Jaminaea rosea]